MGPRIAVVGVSSLIGEAVLDELRKRKFAHSELHALDEQRHLGSAASADQEGSKRLDVDDVDGFDFARVDLAFFCTRTAVAERYAPVAAQHAWVVDGSTAFRARSDLPLVVADVNGDTLQSVLSGGVRHGLVALPGSASVALATVLAPLRAAGLQRVEVATYQAVSGSGRIGIDELAGETVAMLSGKPARGRAFGRPIAFNVIPLVDTVEPDGSSREEQRIWHETARVLACPSLPINVTAARVPVFFGHSLAVHVSFDRPFHVAEAAKLLREAPGIELLETDAPPHVPTPGELAMSPDKVYVGRLRSDLTREMALNFWVVADNVRKCAAHNAVSVGHILVNSSR